MTVQSFWSIYLKDSMFVWYETPYVYLSVKIKFVYPYVSIIPRNWKNNLWNIWYLS